MRVYKLIVSLAIILFNSCHDTGKSKTEISATINE